MALLPTRHTNSGTADETPLLPPKPPTRVECINAEDPRTTQAGTRRSLSISDTGPMGPSAPSIPPRGCRSEGPPHPIPAMLHLMLYNMLYTPPPTRRQLVAPRRCCPGRPVVIRRLLVAPRRCAPVGPVVITRRRGRCSRSRRWTSDGGRGGRYKGK